MPRASRDRFDGPDLAARLGLPFVDSALLLRALTHPSWSAEMGGDDYERLEFLGDAVLELVVSEHLHETFPDREEGDLTRMRVSVVRGGALAAAARDLGVGCLIRLGKGAARAGEADRPSILEAVFEAMVGAVYLDGGLDAARRFVVGALAKRLDPSALLDAISDAKTRLQEITQGRGMGLPSYVVVSQEGPDHHRTFEVEVLVEGRAVGRGRGPTKQAASQAAAAEGLGTMG